MPRYYKSIKRCIHWFGQSPQEQTTSHQLAPRPQCLRFGGIFHIQTIVVSSQVFKEMATEEQQKWLSNYHKSLVSLDPKKQQENWVHTHL